MSYLSVKNVKIVGMSACVPKDVEENILLPIFKDREEAQRVIDSTGIERKRVVKKGTTASDLAYQSVNELLTDLGWEKESIDCLVYVGISRDYIAPITSAILQGRLGLRQDCFCIDLPLGCSGWVFGLSTIGSLLSHGDMKRGLLVNAETNSLNRSKRDKTVNPLFGDAGTVTALEFDSNWTEPMQFEFGADGTNYKAVWTEFGGIRNPTTPEALQEKEVEPGIWRKGTDMVVNGMDVFSFAIRVPPKSLQNLIGHFAIDTEKVDYLFLHQSNKYIDDRIRKKLKMPESKVPYCLKDYGNTSGPSIPLTMISCCAEALKARKLNNLACGFGVGLAWASAHFTTESLKSVILSDYAQEDENA